MVKSMKVFSALIIEPNASMRASLHNLLGQCGLTKIAHAVSSSTAVRFLDGTRYDLVVCGHDLGVGQNGQQLLEDLRRTKLLPMSTMFFMVTGEREERWVISAAELLPTQYILKPFAASTLMERIVAAIKKQEIFDNLHAFIDAGDLANAVNACKEGELAYPRYLLEFKRFRADLYLNLGEAGQAAKLYQHLLDTGDFPWAKLGYAKALFLQHKYDECKHLLVAMIAENSKYMETYDLLAKVHEASGALTEALAILQTAVELSPHALRRIRHLGEIALEVGDDEVAGKAFESVVAKSRNSEFKDPQDHLQLIKSLIKHGDIDKAALAARDLQRTAFGNSNHAICQAIASSLIYEKKGDLKRVDEELKKAIEEWKSGVAINADTQMALAAFCVERNMHQSASEIAFSVLSNPESGQGASQAKAKSLLKAIGRDDLAEQQDNLNLASAMAIISEGAQKARGGDYESAVALMFEAVRILPEHPLVVLNTIIGTLKYLENLGWNDAVGSKAKDLIDVAKRIDPTNTKLPGISKLYHGLLKKYGMEAVPSVHNVQPDSLA